MTHQPTITRQLFGIGKELAIATIPPALVAVVVGVVVMIGFASALPGYSQLAGGLGAMSILIVILGGTRIWLRYLSNLEDIGEDHE